jgi:hypothetical protein
VKSYFEEQSDEYLVFYFFGLASLAKTIAFRSMAVSHMEQENRVSAVISGYYSLLHMTIGLMYFCPQYMQESQLKKYHEKIADSEDPTSYISHRNALNFLEGCLSKGLPKQFPTLFRRGKELRKYVNYAPRINLEGIDATFGNCQYSTEDADQFVTDCDRFIINGIAWGIAKAPTPDKPLQIALNKVAYFFEQSDLFYKQWLPDNVLTEGLQFTLHLQEAIRQ